MPRSRRVAETRREIFEAGSQTTLAAMGSIRRAMDAVV
jgi:hypothetical protein